MMNKSITANKPKSFFNTLFSCCLNNKQELNKINSLPNTSSPPSQSMSISVSDIDIEKIFEGNYFYIHDLYDFLEIIKKVKGIILLYNKNNHDDIKNLYHIQMKLKKNNSLLSLININYKLTLLSTDSPYAHMLHSQYKYLESNSSYCILAINKDTSTYCASDSNCNSKTSTADIEYASINMLDVLSYVKGVSFKAVDKISIDNIGLSIGMYSNRKTSSISLVKDLNIKSNNSSKNIDRSMEEYENVL